MKEQLKIVVTSGKGGTGKTFVSTNLAASAEVPLVYADCDVEAPNGFLFLNPEIEVAQPVSRFIPQFDTTKCTLCKKCVDFCAYNALVQLKDCILLFGEMCHSCKGCMFVCPENAIRDGARAIGTIRSGKTSFCACEEGRLDIGEAMAPPLIEAVKETADRLKPAVQILDAPPGTSCPVVSTISGSDYVLLVAEPTPFGLHDLRLTVDMIRRLGVPMGVALNRIDGSAGEAEAYCRKEGLPILMRIPLDRKIAEIYAQGKLLAREFESYRIRFQQLLQEIIWRAHGESS